MSHGAFWGPYYSRGRTTPSSVSTTSNMVVEVDESSGFHVFELHAPTAGVSFFALVCALIAVGLAYGCYKKCCFGRMFAGLEQAPVPPPPCYPMQPLPPQPHPDPMQPLLGLLALQQAFNPAPVQPHIQSLPYRPPARPAFPRFTTLPMDIPAACPAPAPTLSSPPVETPLAADEPPNGHAQHILSRL